MNENEKQNVCVTVLVEEEERVRRYWREFFDERAVPLLVFESADVFLKTVRPGGNSFRFFFDQDMGDDRGVGIRLARHVQHWRERLSTALVTAYPPGCFTRELQENIIDAVLSKYPSKIFGERFFETRIRREIEERGLTPILEDSIDRLSTAYQELYAVHGHALSLGLVKPLGGRNE